MPIGLFGHAKSMQGAVLTLSMISGAKAEKNVMMACILINELYFQAQVVLQGKSRAAIIRELQRTVRVLMDCLSLFMFSHV